jgi:hypothetical protein
MPRKYVGGSLVLNVVADWPLVVTSAGLDGTVVVTLPGANGVTYNRPDKVHVVYFPGTPAAGLSADALLAGGPAAVVDTPGAGALGNDVPVSLSVTGPFPAGTVTVVAIGEFLT